LLIHAQTQQNRTMTALRDKFEKYRTETEERLGASEKAKTVAEASNAQLRLALNNQELKIRSLLDKTDEMRVTMAAQDAQVAVLRKREEALVEELDLLRAARAFGAKSRAASAGRDEAKVGHVVSSAERAGG
jgi:hypothetical protein